MLMNGELPVNSGSGLMATGPMGVGALGSRRAPMTFKQGHGKWASQMRMVRSRDPVMILFLYNRVRRDFLMKKET